MTILVIGNDSDDFVGIRGELLNSIKSNHHDIIVCGPKPQSDNTINKLYSMGIQFMKLSINARSLNPFCDLITAYQILSRVRKTCPDLVLLLTLKPIVYGSLITRYLGVKLIYSLNSGIGRVFAPKNLIQKALYHLLKPVLKKSYQFNTKYFFQNHDDINMFIDLGIISKKKAVRVNGTGVNLSLFKYRANKVKTTIKFIMICRLLHQKGIYEYCEAAKIIKLEHSETVDFSLVGNFEQSSYGLTHDELNSHIGNHVKYLGQTSNVKPYLESHNVFVLPSYYREGVPRIIMEAMAVGMPVITTNSTGCRDTINGKNGLLIESRCINSLVTAITYLIENKVDIPKMSQEGRKFVESKFNINDINNAMLSTMGLSTH